VTAVTPVLTGLDRLARSRDSLLPSGTAGVLCHAASVDRTFTHVLSILKDMPRITVGRVFAPEHGLWAAAQDQVAVIGDDRDPFTGAPVTSLYGATRESLVPDPADLAGLNFLLVDLQDVGSRYYTFALTACYLAEAALLRGLPVFVLDRPNPLDGCTLEGPPLEEGFHSFVGDMDHLPVRHGLTIAELLVYYARSRGLDLAGIHPVVMEGWHRSQYFDDTGLPWVLPSPNMPTFSTALVYPGGCLLEGATLSEGRGTTLPFQVFGHPEIDPLARRSRLDADACRGCTLRPLWFEPVFHKHAGLACGGWQVHVTDPARLRSLSLYTAVLSACLAAPAIEPLWRGGVYEFETDRLAIDLLFGHCRWREALEEGVPVPAMETLWRTALQASPFFDLRRESLLYPAD